jgi:hypothetical protein
MRVLKAAWKQLMPPPEPESEPDVGVEEDDAVVMQQIIQKAKDLKIAIDEGDVLEEVNRPEDELDVEDLVNLLHDQTIQDGPAQEADRVEPLKTADVKAALQKLHELKEFLLNDPDNNELQVTMAWTEIEETWFKRYRDQLKSKKKQSTITSFFQPRIATINEAGPSSAMEDLDDSPAQPGPSSAMEDLDDSPTKIGPSKPAQAGPSKPAQAGPSKPAQAGPSKPAQAGPSKPAKAGPSKKAQKKVPAKRSQGGKAPQPGSAKVAKGPKRPLTDMELLDMMGDPSINLVSSDEENQVEEPLDYD